MADLVGYLIVGMSSTGKTTLARGIIGRYLAGPRRIVMLDPKEGADSLETVPGFAHFPVRGGEWEPGSVEWAKLIAERRRVRIAVSGLAPDESDAIADELAAAVKRCGDTLFVLDEAADFCSPEHDKHGDLIRLFTGGRHEGVHLLLITQMPVSLNIVARKQVPIRCVLQMAEENDAAKAASLAGVSEKLIMSLPKYHAVGYHALSGKWWRLKTDCFGR